MTDFVDTDAGYINVSSIVRITQKPVPATDKSSGAMRTVIEYRDASGDPKTTTSYAEPDEIGGTIVPAIPGYSVVSTCTEVDGSLSAHTAPIIAWRVQTGIASPICVDWSDQQYNPCYIVQPDGRVIQAGSATYRSVESWLEEMNEQEQKN